MPFDRPENILLELTTEDFKLWQHHRITAAFFQFIRDLGANCDGVALQLFKAGAFVRPPISDDTSPEFLRGRIVALDELQRIELADIQRFYGEAEPGNET